MDECITLALRARGEGEVEVGVQMCVHRQPLKSRHLSGPLPAGFGDVMRPPSRSTHHDLTHEAVWSPSMSFSQLRCDLYGSGARSDGE